MEYSSDLNNQNDQPNKKEVKNKKTVVTLIVIIIILLATLVGGYIYFQSKINADNNLNDNNENSDTSDDNDKEEDNPYKVLKWNNSITYTPSKSFYKETGDDYEYKYTNIATLENGDTVVRSAGWWNGDYFLIDKDNNITFLEKYSVSTNEDLATGIKMDNEITIPEIFPEEDITYNGQKLKFKYHSLAESETATDFEETKLQSTKYGDLYEYKSFITDDFYVRKFYVKTQDTLTLHYYELENVDLYNDDNTLNVNWDDETNKAISWNMPISSCGNNGARLHVKGFNTSMGTKVGTTKANKPIYKLTNDTMLKTLYDEYNYIGEDLEGNATLTFDEFKTKLTSVVYQDSLGEWIVVENDKYSHAGECGKPVIYLYPEQDTYVNVEVGANITVSDPIYTKDGWKNVLAKTNGNLIYQGKEYDSLFWEGIGYGTYPNINKVGKVVTHDNMIKTIEQDLKNQGLNNKEIADFVEFWKEHLPNAPYVKLTWLTTEQINTLAPLKVSPKPDTIIRVFLDAKGLEKPVQLTSQKLTKPERAGFTLVEWGGLLKK